MKKTIRLGVKPGSGNIYCKIEIKNGKLSISGVEGPQGNGNCLGSCGQIDMHLRDEQDSIELAPGWTKEMLARFFDVWKEWHLNDMQAGSPAQREWIAANPLDTTYPLSHFEVYRDALTDAGINPDPNYIHNGRPYAYGSAWLQQELPQDVIDFLATLPETDKQPAWV